MNRPGFFVLALLFCATATAGPLRFGAGLWDYEVTGNDVDNGVRRDFQSDLAVQPTAKMRLALEFDWRDAWFPDLAATYSEFGGEGNVAGETGDGLLGLGGGSAGVETRAELRNMDITLRWPLAIGAVTFSPGLSLQKLDGEVTIEDPANNSHTRQELDEIFPQLHGELRWEPTDWASLSGVVQAIASGDQAANEYRIMAGVNLFSALRIEAGWQQKRYDLKQDDFELHARLRGLLFQAGLTF